jgi:hypothetical protein
MLFNERQTIDDHQLIELLSLPFNIVALNKSMHAISQYFNKHSPTFVAIGDVNDFSNATRQLTVSDRRSSRPHFLHSRLLTYFFMHFSHSQSAVITDVYVGGLR